MTLGRHHGPGRSSGEVTIGVVGKYVGLRCLQVTARAQSWRHRQSGQVSIHWLDAEMLANADLAAKLEPLHGILVPGGFGERGSGGKIVASDSRANVKCLFRHLPGHADGLHRRGAQHRRDRQASDHRFGATMSRLSADHGVDEP
jgi:CTP synthase